MRGHTNCPAWLMALMFAASPALADTTWTGGGDGSSWSDAANWGGTPPAGQRRVFINGTPTVNIDAAVNDTFNRLLLGDGGSSDNVSVHMTGGTLNITGASDAANFELASVGQASFRLSGGSVNVDFRLRIGVDPPPATPVGLLIVDGGNLTVGNRFYVGAGEGSDGTLNMESGSITAGQIFVPDGVNAQGRVNMTGGTITADALWVPTNLDAIGGNGHIQLDGGTIQVDDFRLTNSAELGIQGTMDIRGGTLIVAGDARTTLTNYVTNGWLTGYGFADTGHVVINFDGGLNRTTVTALADASCFILPADPPDGAVGVPYSVDLQSAPDCTDVAWQIVSGRLPDGLSLDPLTGVISGTPAVSGTFEFIVQMSANQASRTALLSITIAQDVTTQLTRTKDVWIRELTPNQPAFEDDRIRIYSPQAGPDFARRWGLIEFDVSALAGASLQGATLKLYQAHAEGNPMKQSAFLIASEPNILTTTWQNYFVNQNGSRQPFELFGRFDLPAATPTDLYYTSAPATLADLALIEAEANGDGKLTLALIPDETGAYSRDWGDGVFSGEPPVLEVDVGSSCVIRTSALPAAVQAAPYAAVLETAPGCGAGSTWEISGCILPPGLTLDPASGAITGRPIYSGLFSFTARMTPGNGGNAQEVDLAINVQPATGDFDGDGDVDGDDSAIFHANFTGPAIPPTCTPVGNEGSELSLPSTTENWVRPSDPNTVYEQDNVQVRSGAAGNVRIGLVEFDVSSLAGQSLQTARIRMHLGTADGGPMMCSAFLIPSGIADATYNSYLANQDPFKQPFAQFGRFELVDLGEKETSLYATAADMQMILNEANGDGLLTLVLFADEDGTAYARKWGDGDIGSKPELLVRTGSACHVQTLDLPPAVAGTPYSATLQTSAACTGAITWQLAQCGLPPGLSLNATTGEISGTPLVAGAYTFQVQANTGQGAQLRNLTLLVNAGADGDFDSDGDVDLDDFHVFALSYTGPLGQRPFCGTTEFASTDTPRNIPDGGSVTSTIAVPAGLTVSDLNLFVDITHGAELDVKITLTSPSGTTVLVKDFIGDIVPFAAKTYDDEGQPPAQPFSAFDGENTAGNWTLTVSDFDTVFIDNGVLNSWKLIITGQ